MVGFPQLICKGFWNFVVVYQLFKKKENYSSQNIPCLNANAKKHEICYPF